MQLSVEQTCWLLKVLQPERTLGSLPGAAALTDAVCAALIGLPYEVYATERTRMLEGAKDAARELLAESDIAAMIEQLPVREGARVVAFGDSHTSDPQSWAVILKELLAPRGVSVAVDAVPGDTTTHGLIRIGQVVAQRPDWVLFFIGTNDARTQGPEPTKTLVDRSETILNLRQLQQRVARETKAQCLWITPMAVNEERVSNHWGLSRFGVRFNNDDLAGVVAATREIGAPVIDLFSALGTTLASELLMDDGLHLTLAGQKRVALEVIRGWSIIE